jgi:hypothetical protein
MGYDSILRSGIATLDRATKSLQVAVTHEAWISADAYSKPEYDDPVTLMAVVTMRQVQRKLPDGREVVHRATLMFTQPVAANGAEGRREPIDPRDRITLPSGFAGVIIDVRGPVDPSTDAPYVLRVELGEAR